MNVRRLSTVLLAAAAALSIASPACASPAIETEPYYGPGYGTHAGYFAGVNATGCLDTYRVYGEPKRCSR